jgi:hypothetical protein
VSECLCPAAEAPAHRRIIDRAAADGGSHALGGPLRASDQSFAAPSLIGAARGLATSIT